MGFLPCDEWTTMTSIETRDWFSDEEIAQDPFPYLAALRSTSPVLPTYHDTVAVTGYDEVAAVFRDHHNFSACVSVVGPFATFDEPKVGDDLAEFVQRNRGPLPQSEHMVTMDQPAHTRERALLMRLLTPKRLSENATFIRSLAEEQLDPIVAKGSCEFIHEYSQPLATLVIAELLGVPREDFDMVRDGFGLRSGGGTGSIDNPYNSSGTGSFGWLDDVFANYIEDRRNNPREDIMSGIATATYPDGTTPDVVAVVRTATFLFAAGQETSARMLAQAVRYLAEQPELQDLLRERPELIPNFIEETLRIQSPTKTDCRLALRPTTIGGVEIPAGKTVAMLISAANHDPKKFPNPDQFQVDRPNARQHLAFGKGIHTCPGSPLARSEGCISIELLLARTRNIRLSEEHHGPASNPYFTYDATWMMRAMQELHIEFDPA